MLQITPGQRLYSAASTVEVIVVKAASVVLECAGRAMQTKRPERAEAAADPAAAVQMSKRYQDEESGLLVLCTKGGVGPLAANGREMTQLPTQVLPSSD